MPFAASNLALVFLGNRGLLERYPVVHDPHRIAATLNHDPSVLFAYILKPIGERDLIQIRPLQTELI